MVVGFLSSALSGYLALVLLLKLGDVTDWRVPILLVLVTGLVGGMLARHQGLAVWRRISRNWVRSPVRMVTPASRAASASAAASAPGPPRA